MTPEQIVRQTYFWDRIRGAAQGILETGYMGLTLIIAIEVFDAPNTIKSLIAAANPIGLMLTPLTLGIFASLNKPANKIAEALLFSSGLCFVLAAFSTSLNAYLIFLTLSAILGTQFAPIMARIYTENYPSNKRGSYLSSSFRFSVAATLIFSSLLGKLMDLSAANYSIVLGTLALATFMAGVSVGRMPSSVMSKHEAQNPLKNLSYAFSDKKFGVMLFSWMFLGLGNLMVIPLRIEYLIQPGYGVEASNFVAAWITLGLPAIGRFVSAKFWGNLFDSIDFMILRMILSALQMLSIFMFFSTTNLWMLSIATAINGVAMGGGNLSWNLWVTKFATRERTAAYMSVHTFLTGLRGIAAPFLGFFLLTRYGSRITGEIGSAMILFSILLIFCLYRFTRPKLDNRLEK